MFALAVGLVSVLGSVAIWAIYHTNTGWAYDTGVYRMGVSIVLHAGDLYAKSTPHPYTYPPFSALLFFPLGLLPPDAASIVWTAFSVAAFIVVAWISLTYLLPDFSLPVRGRVGWGLLTVVILATVWLDPIADTLLAGQVNLVVMALVLTDLLLPDTNRWKGIATGFAATFKLLPLFFVIYLLLTRQFAAAVRAIAAFAATVVIGFIVLPRDSLTYWGGTFLESARVGDSQNPRSESLLSLLVRWSHGADWARPVWLVLEIVVAIGILGLAVWAHRHRDEFLAICIIAAGTLYLSPITWRHHWVWILPMLLWLCFPPPLRGRVRLGAWRWIPIALIALDFYLRPYGGIPVDAQIDLHLSLTQLLLSSTHPVSLLLFLVSSVAILRKSATGSSSTTPGRRRPFPVARPAQT